MLVRPAALLCMDEPTNHLDLAAREVLEEALSGFPGTIVFISHDRYFINRLATTVVEVIRGTLTRHPGNYDDYLAAKSRGALESTPAMKPGRRLRSERRSLGTPPTSSPAWRSAIPRSMPTARARAPSRPSAAARRSGSPGSCTSGRSCRQRSRPMSEP